jgi:hypothetical protein
MASCNKSWLILGSDALLAVVSFVQSDVFCELDMSTLLRNPV